MYAVDNGFYFYQESELVSLKSHLRTIDEGSSLVILLNTLDNLGEADRKEAFADYCKASASRWNDEAKKAIEQFDLEIPSFPTENYKRGF
jgi:hypothetical protein